MRDTDLAFHREWLGLAQPIEGLVFSVPVLADAQIAPKIRASLTAELQVHLQDTDSGPALRDVRAFFEEFLGYRRPGMLLSREQLPSVLSFYAPEGRQEIRPSFAIARGPFQAIDDDPFAQFAATEQAAQGIDAPAASQNASPYVALVWDLAADTRSPDVALTIDLDKNEAETGPWRYPPTAKLERLLRHTGVPIGFVCNRRELRVLYAPAGESSAHLTFCFENLVQRAGRPLVAALELIFHAERSYGAASQFTFEGLLRESRLRQVDVTKDLAAQVFEAVEILIEGFEHAAARDCVGDRLDWLRAALEEPDDHFYQGILSVVLRVVFTLYAEDQSLVPVQHPIYAEHLSVLGLYERLAADAGSHPESMHLRFGAYGRLVALFRAMFLGVTHEDLRLPPRSGKLFDPSAFPFLEGGLPGWTAAITLPEQRAAVQLPSVDDDTIYRVLHRLVVFEGQRLSYRSLDVEQIGAVYESLMGYHVLRVQSAAVRLGAERVWAESDAVRAMSETERKRFWKETCGLSASAQEKAEAAVGGSVDLDALAEQLAELTPGGKAEKSRHRAAIGRLVLQPGEERRRTGSHYTPRWLSEKVVKRTLEPILACLGEQRSVEQILSFKICDPAMGSGAFLVATCRLLAQEVVDAWDRAGKLAALTEQYGDALLHARRLVAQRCLYGVDKNAAAVELAKLSLWLVTLSKELPFTFVDHALRHGDSLVGLELDQIRGFHWGPSEQLETCGRALEDALEQAIEHRALILQLAENEDAVSQREKQRLLEYAEQSTARMRMIADACVGAFFACDKAKSRELERNARLELVRKLFDGDEKAREQLEMHASEIRQKHAPFHWMLEFPEVFYLERPDPLDEQHVNRAAFMEAFVGNPPFAGKNRIVEQGGPAYLEWLQVVHKGAHGNADLSAHFFLRIGDLLGHNGSVGLIATQTIAQGDTRATGLERLIGERGFEIYDATSAVLWPGSAAVTVSMVHLAVGRPRSQLTERRLDGALVAAIDSRLRRKVERVEPVALAANAGCSFIGIYALGMGFVLTPEERHALIASDQRNAELVFPYLGGDEINTSPTQTFERYLISFGQMTLEEAQRWPDLIALVREKVKPERDRLKDNPDGRRRKAYWWQFGRWTPALFGAIATLDRCLVIPQQFPSCVRLAFQPTDRIFSQKLVVLPLATFTAFAVLQSRVHDVWTQLHCGRMGAANTPVYSPSACFDSFPFPVPNPRTTIETLECLGEQLYQTRAAFMIETAQGLTKTYNALKNPNSDDFRVLELRHLHEQVDRAVLATYGWTDIPVPAFCGLTNEDRVARQAFEDEVINRLYVLNAERTAEEARLGLHAKKAKQSTGKKSTSKTTKRRTSTDAMTLPGIDDEADP